MSPIRAMIDVALGGRASGLATVVAQFCVCVSASCAGAAELVPGD